MQKTNKFGIRLDNNQLGWLLKERSKRDCSASEIIRGLIDIQIRIDEIAARLELEEALREP